MNILGPLMIPDKEMERYHEDIGDFLISFSKEQIALFRDSFHKNGYDNNISRHHSEVISGTKMIESFLIDKESRKVLPNQFQHLPDGTWMIEHELTDVAFEELEKSGAKGFSGEITYKVKHKGKFITIKDKFRRMNKLSDKLSFEIYVQGGSTDGRGRNEHGEAHFEIKEKNSKKSLGKIYMPTMEKWSISSVKERIQFLTLHEGKGLIDISAKEKKEFVDWLEDNNNSNLSRCHEEWNRVNKDNKRVFHI